MTESEAKRKDVADDHDLAQDKEFVPDDAEGEGAGGKPEELDPEEVKEVLEDDEVDNKEPAAVDEDQEAEVEEVYDSGVDLNEGIESEVSVEDDDNQDKDKPRRTKRENEGEHETAPNKKQKESAAAGDDDDDDDDDNAADTKSETNGAEAEGKVGSKHDDPRDPEMQGSAERLPEVGQQVEWKALPGFVDGKVVEIVREKKEVNGKSVKASEDSLRLVLKSNKSGKIYIHKPEAVYFK